MSVEKKRRAEKFCRKTRRAESSLLAAGVRKEEELLTSSVRLMQLVRSLLPSSPFPRVGPGGYTEEKKDTHTYYIYRTDEMTDCQRL